MIDSAAAKTFTVRLTHRMQEANMTETELAKRMKVEPSLVRRWKCGNAYPQGTMMRRLAKVLHLEEAYLSGESKAKAEAAAMAEQKAIQAEADLIDGVSVEDAVLRCGYRNVREMFAAIAHHGKAAEYTADEMASFYQNFNQGIKDKGMTHLQLSWTIGMGTGTISNWAAGNRMPARCLIPRIAAALGMTGRELLGGPPLIEDRAPAPPPEPPEKPEPAPAEEAGPQDGELSIVVRYAAEAKGRHAHYAFDGSLFSVTLLTPLADLTPETLSDIGEELQKAAIAMIR